MKKALLLIILLTGIVFAQESLGIVPYLLDVKMEIPKNYKMVSPGEELLVSIKLINMGSNERVDVFLDYWITDSEQYWNVSEDSSIPRKQETVAVETQLGLVRDFYIPKNTKPGRYYLYLRVTYADGQKATAKDIFEVIETPVVGKTGNEQIYYWIAYLSAFIIIVGFIVKERILIKKIKIRVKVRKIVKKRLNS